MVEIAQEARDCKGGIKTRDRWEIQSSRVERVSEDLSLESKREAEEKVNLRGYELIKAISVTLGN